MRLTECFERVLLVARGSEKTHQCERPSGRPHTPVSVPWRGVCVAAFAQRACFVRAAAGLWDPAVLPESERPCVPGGAWSCLFPRAEALPELLLGGARGEKQGGGLDSRPPRGAPLRKEHVRLGACSVSVPLWACSQRYPPPPPGQW